MKIYHLMREPLRSCLCALVMVITAVPASADVRIKDIANFEGVRENHLIGYGLVVGLQGTGDKLNSSPFTRESIRGMLERLGVANLDSATLKTTNTAAVMVTAKLPPFARRRTRTRTSVWTSRFSTTALFPTRT